MTDTVQDSPLVIAGKTYTSRLLVGSGKYKDNEETRLATEASGAEIITVAVRRSNIGQNPDEPNLLDAIPPEKYTILPNTAGCYTVDDAVRTCRLARELLDGHNLVKLEVLADEKTLYPDVIESVRFKGPSATIKTHHNVGGLPARMKLQLIEPLRELFKDEVRVVGEELGLPDEMVYRQPFPGPGLAIRILGSVTPERLRILREADDIVGQEIKNFGLYRELWQAFAVLLPIRSVGVMGDQRTYEHVLAIRAVTSVDAMTADWAKLPYELLDMLSNRLINEVKGINRVVYDVSSKPPATIEWE